MSSRTITMQEALELREAYQNATTCTKCEWKRMRSQPLLGVALKEKGCRHCMGPFFSRTRATKFNMELLESYLAEGDLEGLEDIFWYAFEDRLPATQTTREKGPLIVRSPGRVPILPIKETVQEPKPKKGFKKVKKDC